MTVRTTVVCLPLRSADKALTFYQRALGFSDARVDDGIIALELPNLSLFLMKKNAFEIYTKKAGRGALFPNNNAGAVIGCAMESKEEVDTIFGERANVWWHHAEKAAMDEPSGGYIGYFADPDGHLSELVYPQQQ